MSVDRQDQCVDSTTISRINEIAVPIAGSISNRSDRIIWLTMLFLTAGINICMNIQGMHWLLPSIAKFAMLLGLSVELIKLTFIYTYHRRCDSAGFIARSMLLFGVALFCFLSFVDAFSFLHHYHDESTAEFISLEKELAGLDKEKIMIERKMSEFDKRLSHIPESHVTKYSNMRIRFDYNEMDERLLEIQKKRDELSARRIAKSVSSAGIYPIARIIGQDRNKVSQAFLFLLCVGIEMSSIGSLSALVKMTNQKSQKKSRQISPMTEPKKPDQKKAKKAEKKESEKADPNMVETANSAKFTEEEQQRHRAFMRLCSDHELNVDDVRKLTGKRNGDTVVRWTTGKKVIPEKELRILVKKLDTKKLGDIFTLKNGKNNHERKTSECDKMIQPWMINPSVLHDSKGSEQKTIN